MVLQNHELLPSSLREQVASALAEDVGSGDRTAALIPQGKLATATVKVREAAILCGQPWFEAVFEHLAAPVEIKWHVAEGAMMVPDTLVASMRGPARGLLTGERTALNFLQTLSAVATQTHRFTQAVSGCRTQIVDTRKTLPGLRLAEKYAVRVGGGTNHRLGLYDGILIKENHIAAAGSLTAAVMQALEAAPPGVFVEVEVETLAQLEEALGAGAPMILLDNMTLAQQHQAVALTRGRAILEVSGGVSLDTVREIALTGVDRISVGSLTKDIKAVDFTMRFQLDE
jgi:nicotinate-nucleotide pyrophosphorylase (carboxylating)